MDITICLGDSGQLLWCCFRGWVTLNQIHERDTLNGLETDFATVVAISNMGLYMLKTGKGAKTVETDFTRSFLVSIVNHSNVDWLNSKLDTAEKLSTGST